MLIPNLYAWLLAGGSGERLWPLSNTNQPKQLLELNGKTLLEHSLERISPLVDQSTVTIITTQKYVTPILDKVGDVIGSLCVEPQGRNTAPAIYLAAATLEKQIQDSSDPVIFIMPTDHYVAKPHLFQEFVRHAVEVACDQNSLVLLGIEPTWPATGYGYIEYQKETTPHRVVRFHEKPQQTAAESYLASGNFLWNSGMLCARLSVLIRAFEVCAPEIVQAVDAYLDGNTPYELCPSISMDYAVLEKSNNLVVLPAGFPWCDVGTIETFLALQNDRKATVIEVDARNNSAYIEKGIAAFVGIDDVCVVQKDGALLVAKKGHTEKIRAVVQELKKQNKEISLG
jgi:mannose-1-phosphate guanylyltransferase/mannose-6-phosphate isomerase